MQSLDQFDTMFKYTQQERMAEAARERLAAQVRTPRAKISADARAGEGKQVCRRGWSDQLLGWLGLTRPLRTA